MVGRGDESRWLSSALDAVARGHGDCLFLVGEPGIGKSRIVGEAAAAAADAGVWVLAGRAGPTCQAVPYQSLAGALLHGFRSRPLESLPPDLPGVRAGLAVLLPGLVDGPAVDASPVLLGETILRVADALGARDGALLVLEDLHWACGDTLAVIEYLADAVATSSLMLVGTLRPDGEAPSVVDALARRGVASLRQLAPLHRDDVAEMAAGCLMLDPGEIPEWLADMLHARTEGLPFLVEELLASLAERGALTRSESGWALRGPIDTVDVPSSFSESVRERLTELSRPERYVLQVAAILGRDFDWSHVSRVTELDDSDVLDVLARAVDLQLVDEAGGDLFRFRHALTVEAILAGMLDAQRARLAERALAHLVTDPEHGPSDLLELAAHLAAQAGRAPDAARYLTEEARRSTAGGALATAIATARRARGMVARGSTEALAADEALLSALSQAGDSAAADEVGTELLTALDAVHAPPDRRARVRLLLAHAAHAAMELGRAARLCEEALALHPEPRLEIELRLALAEIAFSRRDYDAVAAGAESAVADADAAGFDDLASHALELLGRHRAFVALELRRSGPYLLESMRRADRAGQPLARLRALKVLAFRDLAGGAESERIEHGRALAMELGALATAAEFDHLLATYHLVANELSLAEQFADRALAEAQRYGMAELEVLVLGLRATIAAVRGQRADAERQAAEAGAAAARFGSAVAATVTGTALVVAAFADDDLPAALARVAETRAHLPERIVFQPPFLGSFHGFAALAQAMSGVPELVEGRDWVPVDDVFQDATFSVARGIVAGRTDDAARATELFTHGDGRLIAVPWVRAVCRRYASEAALADGWGDPATWLSEAEQSFDEFGNEPLARACRSLLRLTGTSPRRRRSGVDESRYAGIELTTREADVLDLLAEGMTNREIAGRLYLSPRTVEKHVERILGKTGQPNRTALAAFATARRPAAPLT
jgi:DNA-binding CsgD family transcriptional regulator